jgi:hypothetical protein
MPRLLHEDVDRWLNGSTVEQALAMQQPAADAALEVGPPMKPEKKAAWLRQSTTGGGCLLARRVSQGVSLQHKQRVSMNRLRAYARPLKFGSVLSAVRSSTLANFSKPTAFRMKPLATPRHL